MGQTLTLTATCTGTPTAYSWTGCSGTSNVCSVVGTGVGFAIYSVVAANASGSGLAAGAAVTWGTSPFVCSGSQAATAPRVGQSVSLAVSCAPAATGYAWINCPGTGAACIATAAAPGAQNYSVTAQGPGGAITTTNFVLAWEAAIPAPPVCTLTPSTTLPVVGTTLVLTASCTNEPTTYFWSGCASNAATCQSSNVSADLVSYSVFGANAIGFSDPATVIVQWIAAPGLGLRAIEYYHAGLDHYFLTADLGEIGELDAGVFHGWARTGESLAVLRPGLSATPVITPVCRFYGNPQAGLDSHFYSATPAECAAVMNNPDWLLESSDVFGMYAVNSATGVCPAATQPVFRLFNQRTDVNHRYTTKPSVFAQMLSRGYVAEGFGSPPVVFCAPGP